MLLNIHSPRDIRTLDAAGLKSLASEIRKKIIETVSHTGGHLASNLGTVELTIALHRVFESPEDALVWDVGHQCYAHKMITGRFSEFDTLRQKGGISGFTKKAESCHDFFDSGHSSTSVSSALGLLMGRELTGKTGKVVAVIGDGALTGGMALEALSHAGQLSRNLIVVLNDNQMSISANTGSISKHLSKLTMSASYQSFRYRIDRFVARIPFFNRYLTSFIFYFKRGLKGLFLKNNFFVDFGFEYVGPLNGHNVAELETVLSRVKKLSKPVVVHVLTQKGRGFTPAENDPMTFHGIGPFCMLDGTVEKYDKLNFTEAFSDALITLAEKDSRIAAVTAAMAKGTGLTDFAKRFPERFFDAGIAEQHAVTFAGGLACAGMKPVAAIYSTFMQRAVDQVIHDVAMQNAPVILALDRAGAVPDDGESHQGMYDIAFFRAVPRLTVLSPASARELFLLLSWAFSAGTPVAIRYPKASCPPEQASFSVPVEPGRGVLVSQPSAADVLFVCTGSIFSEVSAAGQLLRAEGLESHIYNLRFIKPIDEDYFLTVVASYKKIILVEDGTRFGGIGEALCALLRVRLPQIKTTVLGFPDSFIPQGKRSEVLESAGLSPLSIACVAREL